MSIQIAAIQAKCTEDPAANLDHHLTMIRDAATQGADVVCLQELFLRPYPCQEENHDHFTWAEPIPGPTTEQLSGVAAELGVVIIASLFEKRDAGLYHNTAVVIDAEGSLLGKYRKMHIPDDPLYYEKFYFTPGDMGFRAFDTQPGRLGVCVCWDQWFPEAARITALQGARVLFYPTAIGWHPGEKQQWGASQYSAWQTMMRSHAIANGVHVVAANRVGFEGEIEFWGGSFLCDPYGNILRQAPHEEEAILIAECDLELTDQARTHWPFLRDRRIDAYGGLLKRYLDHD